MDIKWYFVVTELLIEKNGDAYQEIQKFNGDIPISLNTKKINCKRNKWVT